MKKFFSLLCATLLVFSASAAPVAKKAELVKKAPVAVEQMQKVQFEKAQSVKTLSLENAQLSNQLSAAPAVKVNNQKATAPAVKANSQKVAKASKQMVRRSAANAKKAAKAPLNTAITIGTFSPATYEGEYYVTLTDANSTAQFFFDFDTSVNPFEVGKTYTLDEMIAEYVAMGDADDWNAWEPATAATYTETVDEKGLTHIVASMTTESGTYDLTYDQPEPQDINVTAVDWGYDGSEYDVYVYSETATYLFELKEDLVYGKAYTYADMVPTWTCTLTSSGYPDITATDATLTVTKDEAGLIHIAATMVLSGNKHIIAYDEKAFVPTGVKIDVNGTDLNGRYLSAYGFYLYTATWGDYTVQLAFDAEEEKAAYTNEEFIADYGLIYSDDEDIQLFKLASDNITITNTETTKTLAGSVYAKNGDEYILNLVYEKPAVETATAIVEDAKLTKTSQFFHVDGNDTKGAYGITLYVVTKNLEGEFTVEDLDVYSSGVTDLSVKKWFDIDSCNIVSEKLGSNTLVISGLLHTSNEQLGRLIDLTFIMTARVDANGELMDIYGGIVTPAKGDTISLTRSEKGTAFFKNPSTGGLSFGAQSGKTTMVAVNDSAYYWYNPISQFTTGYWIKGLKDKQANTINFAAEQVINVYNGGLLGLMEWLKVTTDGKISVVEDGANQFVLGIEEDTLTLQGSAPFDFTQDVIFPGVVVPDYGFQGYGDAGTVLTLNKPITERDTVDVISAKMTYNDFIATNAAVQYYAGDDAGYAQFCVTSKDASSVFGTFDVWADYSWIQFTETTDIDIQEGKITVASEEKGIRLTGWVIGDNEKYYRLNWFKQTVFDERDTVKVNLNSIIIEEDLNSQTETHRGWLFEGQDTDTMYIVQVLGQEKFGTFSYAAGTLGKNFYNIIPSSGQGRCQFTEGEVTIVEDEEGVKLTGLLIGEDEKAYALNWIQPAGRLQYDTDAPFEATFAYSDMEASLDNGVIGIYATNAENLTIGLELYADPTATTIPAGTYVISDTQEAGTALQSLGVAGGYLTECWAGVRGTSGISDCWFMVEGTITLSYDEYGKLKVEVDAKNSYGQPVTALIAYEKIEPKKTVDFTDAELYVYDGYVEKYGIMNFYGGNADGYKFDLYAYADTIAGDFLEAIDFGDCELTSPAGSIGIIDAYEFKVERDGKNLTLTAKVLGSDTVQYNITATGYYGYIQGDAVEGYVGEFAKEEVAIQQVAISKVKYIYIQGENAAGDQLALAVKGELEDDAIAAGTYTEVMACPGFDAQGQLNPSFVGNNAGVWFIQSGELVVNEDGSMEFLGVNSYDATIEIDFTVPAPVTDYYLVGWINNAAYGIEGDIDNFGDYHFVAGEDGALKVKATFDVQSYVQVKDNNKQIYGTDSYVDPVEKGNATLVANGPEKIGINGGDEYEYTLVVNEDGTLKILYEKVTETGLHNTKANVKAAKQIKNGQIVIVRENKEYNILGAAL